MASTETESRRIAGTGPGRRSGRARPPMLPKLCGADIELGNFIMGMHRDGGTGYEASRALLAEIDGFPRRAVSTSHGYGFTAGNTAASAAHNPQDWGRKFLANNGGCIYVDLDHLELCVPEVISAFDHVAAWHAMMRIARQALDAANRNLAQGLRIHAHVNNSDGRSNSYGSHLNFLVTRRAWENLFRYRLHYQLFLASCQASSIVVTGQGKVGAENGAPGVPFQISQRADFFETLCGEQTTYRRPLVNSRDESLCGVGSSAQADMARLHCIFFDSSLCHVSSLLRVGIMQLVLAMIEAECVNPRLILEDPLDSVRRWSHDPTLRARASLLSGQWVTAVELQRMFYEDAERFVRGGGSDGVVPRAEEILALWGDTLGKLEAGDFAALARRLDWVLKLRTLRRAMQRHPGLDFESASIRYLDQLYGSLDTDEGLYWAFEAAGAVDRVVDEERVEHFTNNPPDDTRAWTRALLLRAAGPDSVLAVDWDSVTVWRSRPGYGSEVQKLELSNPLAWTRAAMQDRSQAGGDSEKSPGRSVAAKICTTEAGAVVAEAGTRTHETEEGAIDETSRTEQ